MLKKQMQNLSQKINQEAYSSLQNGEHQQIWCMSERPEEKRKNPSPYPFLKPLTEIWHIIVLCQPRKLPCGKDKLKQLIHVLSGGCKCRAVQLTPHHSRQEGWIALYLLLLKEDTVTLVHVLCNCSINETIWSRFPKHLQCAVVGQWSPRHFALWIFYCLSANNKEFPLHVPMSLMVSPGSKGGSSISANLFASLRT